jgi:hypothetical protein
MKHLVVIFLFCNCALAFGQFVPSVVNYDTLKGSFRTNGDLDSMDIISFNNASSHPGGGSNQFQSIQTGDLLYQQIGGYRNFERTAFPSYRFAAIPHVGFAYSFGTQGTQIAQLNYQQLYARKVLLNLNYENNRSNGYLRNSDFLRNNAGLNILKSGRIYSFVINAQYNSNNSGLNGGITSIADPIAFPMVFLPVSKENARSEYQSSHVNLENYIDFNKDSTSCVGLMTNHQLDVRQRRYTETDTLFGIYNQVNIDSLESRDFYQFSKLSNGAGFFFRKNQFFASTNVNATYWKYFNLDQDRDTTEFSLKSDVKYAGKNWTIQHKLDLNLVGARNEWRTGVELSARFGKTVWNNATHIESVLPDVFQRHYFANNFAYQMSSYEQQFRMNMLNTLTTTVRGIETVLTHQSSFFKENYLFLNGQWRNDTLTNFSFHRIGLRVGLKWGILHVQPEYTFTIRPSTLQIVPTHTIRARVLLKGALFKAKKMKTYLGVDAIYVSGFDPMSFLPAMDVYSLNTNGISVSSFNNLHVFGGFQIDQFRFFVRFENIGYFWNDNSLELLEGYPIAGGQLRVGLTWDFFN